MKFVVQ